MKRTPLHRPNLLSPVRAGKLEVRPTRSQPVPSSTGKGVTLAPVQHFRKHWHWWLALTVVLALALNYLLIDNAFSG